MIIIINEAPKLNWGKQLATGLTGLIGITVIWWILASFYEPFILPSPLEVTVRFLDFVRQGGALAGHFGTTFLEALLGFLIGAAAALPLSYYMYRHPVLNQLITPYVVGIQAVPIVALAPLLVIWFGYGPLSKILIAGLVAFFPVLTNGIIGLREVDPRLKELLVIMGASPQTVFYKLEVPSALPVLFGGLKMGLTLAVIGAVVGEFSGAGQGLGYLVNLARGSFDTALIFIALIALAILGIGFYALLSLLEYWVMPWKRNRK
ncbi:MAG TPA: ABC transporter permease [Bacillota bacterium]|nr:ABC transporter permease [Bacillota bacterium]